MRRGEARTADDSRARLLVPNFQLWVHPVDAKEEYEPSAVTPGVSRKRRKMRNEKN